MIDNMTYRVIYSEQFGSTFGGVFQLTTKYLSKDFENELCALDFAKTKNGQVLNKRKVYEENI